MLLLSRDPECWKVSTVVSFLSLIKTSVTLKFYVLFCYPAFSGKQRKQLFYTYQENVQKIILLRQQFGFRETVYSYTVSKNQ